MNHLELRIADALVRVQRFFAQRRLCCERKAVVPVADLSELIQRIHGAYDPLLRQGTATHGPEHLQAIIDHRSRHPATEHDIAMYNAFALWTSSIGDSLYLGTLYYDSPGQEGLRATACVFLEGRNWFILFDGKITSLLQRDDWVRVLLRKRTFNHTIAMTGALLHEVTGMGGGYLRHVDVRRYPA